MKFIATQPICLQYLPEEQEWDKLPKQWLCNVIHTVLEDEFSGWVKDRIQQRNLGIVKQKNLAVNMDPEIMNAFLSSTAVSSKYDHIIYS